MRRLKFTVNCEEWAKDRDQQSKGSCYLYPKVVFLYTLLSVQFSRSVVSDSVTPWTAARQASLSITNSWSAPKPMSIESVMPSNHLILHRPLLLLPSIFPSIGVFSNESALRMRWPKYWSFSFTISPSNEHPGLIFRMDWLDLLVIQGTLKSLLQYHTSKATLYFRVTICWWGSVFFFRRGMRILGYYQCTRSNERKGLGQQSSAAAETSDERLTGLMMPPSQCWGREAAAYLTEFLDTLSYRAHCCT